MEGAVEEPAVAAASASCASLAVQPPRLHWTDVDPLTERQGVVRLRNLSLTPQRVRILKRSGDGVSVSALSPGEALVSGAAQTAESEEQFPLCARRKLAAPPQEELLASRVLAPGLAVRLLVKTSTLLHSNLQSRVWGGSCSASSFNLPIEARLPVVQFFAPSQVRFEKALVGERRKAALSVRNAGKLEVHLRLRRLSFAESLTASPLSGEGTSLGEEREPRREGRPLSSDALKAALPEGTPSEAPFLEIEPSSLRLAPGQRGEFSLSAKASSPMRVEFRLSLEAQKIVRPPTSPRQSLLEASVDPSSTRRPQSSKTLSKIQQTANRRESEGRLWRGDRERCSAVVSAVGEWSPVHWRLEVPKKFSKFGGLGEFEEEDDWQLAPSSLNLGGALCGEVRCASLRLRNSTDFPLFAAFRLSPVRAASPRSGGLCFRRIANSESESKEKAAAGESAFVSSEPREEAAATADEVESQAETLAPFCSSLHAALESPLCNGGVQTTHPPVPLSATSSSRSSAVRSILLTDVTPRLSLSPHAWRCRRCRASLDGEAPPGAAALLQNFHRRKTAAGAGPEESLRGSGALSGSLLCAPRRASSTATENAKSDVDQRFLQQQRQAAPDQALLKSSGGRLSFAGEGRPQRRRVCEMPEAQEFLEWSEVSACVSPSTAVVPPRSSVFLKVLLQSRPFRPQRGFQHAMRRLAASASAVFTLFAEVADSQHLREQTEEEKARSGCVSPSSKPPNSSRADSKRREKEKTPRSAAKPVVPRLRQTFFSESTAASPRSSEEPSARSSAQTPVPSSRPSACPASPRLGSSQRRGLHEETEEAATNALRLRLVERQLDARLRSSEARKAKTRKANGEGQQLKAAPEDAEAPAAGNVTSSPREAALHQRPPPLLCAKCKREIEKAGTVERLSSAASAAPSSCEERSSPRVEEDTAVLAEEGGESGCSGVLKMECRFFVPALRVARRALDFGEAALEGKVLRTLRLKNETLEGGGRVAFRVKVPGPFACSPRQGSLAPGEALSLKVAFTPRQKVRYSARLQIFYGPEEAECESVLLKGTGADCALDPRSGQQKFKV